MNPTELVEKAERFIETGEFDKALTAIEEAIKAAPDDRSAWAIKGGILMAKGDFSNAASAMKKTVGLAPDAPDNADIIPALAMALNESGQNDEALSTIAEYGKDFPDILENPSVLLQQGVALNTLGKPAAALEALAKIPELAGEPENLGLVHLQRGLAQQMLNAHEKALTHFQAAQELIKKPAFRAYLWLHQARSQLALGDPKGAAEAVGNAGREPGPFPPTFWFQRGTLLNALGRYEEALADLDIFIADTPNSFQAWDQKAAVLFGLNRFPEALAAVDRAIELMPDSLSKATTTLAKAELLLKTNETEPALAALDAAGKLDPSIEGTLKFVELKNRTLLLLHRYDAVAELVTTAWKNPELAANPSFQLMSIDALVFAGKISEAMELIRSVAGKEPDKDNAGAWLSYATALSILGRFADSLTALSQAKSLDPNLADSPTFLTYSINGFLNTGRHEEALEAANAFVALQPTHPISHSLRAAALANLAQYDEALVEFDKSIELTGTELGAQLFQSFALVQKAGALTAMRQWGNAIDAFKKARTLAAEACNIPNQVSALFGEALAVYGRSRTEEESRAKSSKLEALRLVTDAVDLTKHSVPDPVRAAAWWSKGNILSWLERDEEALIAYAEARKYQPHAAGILLSLGVLYERLEDNERAIEAFSEAANHGAQPAIKAEAWLGKGRALQHLDRDDEAIAACREAIALNGEDEQILLVLGTAYSGLGRHKAALAAFRRGWALGKPRHRSAALALGVSAELLNLDRNAEARSFLEKAEHDATFTGQMHLNYGIALYRLKDTGAAAKALRKAAQAGVPGAEEYAEKLAGGGQNRSWLDFWFGPLPWMRKILGCVLLTILGLALLPALLTPDALCFLPWLDLSKDWKVMLIPIVLVSALLVLPILTRFAVGPIEVGVSQPEPKAAVLDLDSALKALQSISSTTPRG